MSNYLKPLSVVAVIVLILLAPSIRDALKEEAATYVNDSESSHNGLPESWNNSQVFCVLFLDQAPHPKFTSGVTMIESDGSILGTNSEYNGTGACVGGFSGYENGLDLMNDAVIPLEMTWFTTPPNFPSACKLTLLATSNHVTSQSVLTLQAHIGPSTTTGALQWSVSAMLFWKKPMFCYGRLKPGDE